MTLEGVMHDVWHKPGWLGPVYWALGKLGVLVPYTGREVPTTVQIVPVGHGNVEISALASRIALPEQAPREHYHEARTTGMSAKCVSIL